jgi:hypothetical protein
MYCADSWLLTGESFCPICRRDIFLTRYASDEENNGVTATKQTSLLQLTDDGGNSVADSMRDHQIGNFELYAYSCFFL